LPRAKARGEAIAFREEILDQNPNQRVAFLVGPPHYISLRLGKKLPSTTGRSTDWAKNFAEPKGHVEKRELSSELQAAADAGFKLVDRPVIRRAQAALLKKS
jgi:hypothetical protein